MKGGGCMGEPGRGGGGDRGRAGEEGEWVESESIVVCVSGGK